VSVYIAVSDVVTHAACAAVMVYSHSDIAGDTT
jgi:hypothetical protein